jgi:hypothetical protein
MTITLQDILLIVATVSAPIVATQLILHRQNTHMINEFFVLLLQFPLHRHFNGKILYPVGTKFSTHEDQEGSEEVHRGQ